MAKKQQQLRKNSRASRRTVADPEIDLDLPVYREDPKARVLTRLAENAERSGNAARPVESGLDHELSAISSGAHSLPKGKVAKRKHTKKDKKRQQRAEILKDMLSEKITLAKQRHKTIKSYRKGDDSDKKIV